MNPFEEQDRAARKFTGRYERWVVPGAGHFLPQETPEAVVRALTALA